MEVAVFIEKLRKLFPEIHRVEDDLSKEFYPSPPGINALCSGIGWLIAEHLSSIKSVDEVFDLIENGMSDGSDELKDAIATGLIEALISQTDSYPGTWEKITQHLGPLSDAYAKDWIRFTDTGKV